VTICWWWVNAQRKYFRDTLSGKPKLLDTPEGDLRVSASAGMGARVGIIESTHNSARTNARVSGAAAAAVFDHPTDFQI
jgi:hypothetical protein